MYRDGKEMKVSASELVPGDLVRLYIGDRVPADMRIVECCDLKVNDITGLHTGRMLYAAINGVLPPNTTLHGTLS